MSYNLFINGESVGTIAPIQIKQDFNKLDLKEMTLEINGNKFKVYMEKSVIKDIMEYCGGIDGNRLE